MPIDKLEYCFNLQPLDLSMIMEIYLNGKKPSATESCMTPKNTSFIRQDILASIFVFEFKLSHKEFIVVKNLATARNMRLSRPSEEEKGKWPARPDVFLWCNEPKPDAVSDDDIAEYFIHEKYNSTSSESENTDDNESEDRYNFGTLSYPVLEAADETPNHRKSTVVVNGERVNTCGVDLLRHLYVNRRSFDSIQEVMNIYKIGRTKAYDCWNAITALLEGKLCEVTCEMFENTFSSNELMNMPMQADKYASIKLVTSILP